MVKLKKRFTGAVITAMLSLSCLMPAMADTKADVQQEISELEDEQSAMESQLADLKANKSDLESYIGELDAKIDEVLSNMNALSDEIVLLDAELHTAQLKLIEAEANQAEQYKALKARIKVLYENGEDDYLQVLLGESDLKSFLGESEYREKISSYDSSLLEQLQESALQISRYKDDLEKQQQTFEAKADAYENEKASLDMILEERESELSAVEANIVSADYDISAITEQIEAENQKLANILYEEQQAAEQKRLAEEAQKAAAAESEKVTESAGSNTGTGDTASTDTNQTASEGVHSDSQNSASDSDSAKESENSSSSDTMDTGNSTDTGSTTSTATSSSTSTYDGPVLTASAGTIMGPSGKETYYNLDMSGVVSIMRGMGFSEEEYPYWVRSDGCKMLGDYIMCAANLNVRPRGTTVESSLGTCLVCDTGGFASSNSTQLDIATNW